MMTSKLRARRDLLPPLSDDGNFIEKLIIIIQETSTHTEHLMESLVVKAQGLVEELIDFKSAFPKCDTIRAAVDNCASK